MAQSENTIFVYENWRSENPSLFGRLHIASIRGQEIYSFEYSDEWLNSFNNAYSLDPNLSLYRGRQYTPIDRKTFGLFADSCPDRWGRLLMKRKEAINALKENRKPRNLTESAFLLGVYDESRMGALRFSQEEGGVFLSNEKTFATPPWTNLRTLENAAIAFENDDRSLDEKWLRELLAPGSSLGGTRPKATVQAPDGSLWIAKFPSKHDEYNSGAWEKVVHDLSRLCSLNVPESKLVTFSTVGSTFLVKRFDRDRKRRIHFASAMTLLGKTDGDSAVNGTSYLDLVTYIRAYGTEPRQDLIELWKRMVFNMAVTNTDDHLRNHGFILTPTGWRLSPLFDVNPTPSGDRLSLNVSQFDNRIDLLLAIEVSEYFGIKNDDAKKLSEDIIEI
ncbi:MAG: type II toxin-antitoxin system HipA family toxin, partial [Clostridiales bacterium]|nr:type II toxin-antitoxin system HipA family toxin [Clostridiales bacterium]